MKNFYRDRGLFVAIICLVLLMLGLSVFLYINVQNVFWIIAPFIVLTSGFAIGKLIQVTRRTHQYFAYIDDEVELVNRVSLYSFPLGAVIVDKSSNIIWFNKNFSELFPEAASYGNSLNMITELTLEKLLEGENEISINQKYFSITATIPKDKDESEIFLIYFKNITEQRKIELEKKLSKPIVIIFMIDSYDELFNSNLESEKARITVQIDKLLEDFIKETNGILKKNSRDRFWAVIEQRYIDKMVSEKVKLLDKAREIQVTNRMSLTLSIGIGVTASTISESEQFALQAIEMAQGRGGDQAAVKTKTGFEFFGGVSKGVERQTRIKPRIIASSLIELIESSESVYIMGHKFSDLDSVGACVGLTCGIRNLGKKAYAVVNLAATLAMPLIEHMSAENEPKNPIFISPNEAKDTISENSLLIIVDTHNLQLIEDKEIYQRIKKVVIIDHHRKMVNYIDNAIIFHHEPYSSSASEMVAELLQYFGNAGKLTPLQAEALLSGIMLDTKNFAVKTGVRTFEAAAFLRKLGADTINVKGLFANSIDAYKLKVHLVAGAKIYHKCAIASTSYISDEMRIIAPQAADELLTISNVDASFVLYKTQNGEIYISARSLGSINVQLIMESMGGGGHLTMAGVQIKNISIEEAEKLLYNSIDKYYGDLKSND